MKIYVDKNALQDYTTKLIAKEKTIFATKNEVGSPLVASTISEMTDHDKIYVYVGSETGYTSGNWYYWDGSAWTSGGIYNSEGFVLDDTLTSATLPAQAKAVGDKVNQLSEDIYAQSSVNKWNPSDTLSGKGISNSISTYGDVIDADGYTTSGLIPVIKGQTIIYYYADSLSSLVAIGSNVFRLAEYNAGNECLLVSPNWTHMPYAVQNDATKYVRLQTYGSHAYYMAIINDSDVRQKAFVPFGGDPNLLTDLKRRTETLEETVADIQNPAEVILPSAIYGVTGQEINIYKENLLYNNRLRMLAYIHTRLGNNAVQDDFRTIWNPSANTLQETNRTWEIMRYGLDHVETKTIKECCVPKDTGSSTIKALIIGDSKVQNGYVSYHFLHNFDDDAMTCVLLGTKYKWQEDNRSEGYGSRTAKWFCTDEGSPFYHDGGFDFAYYLSHNSIDTPDYVFVNLGTNDCASVSAGTSAYYTEFVSYIGQMIESVHAVSNNIVFIVGMCEGCCTDQDVNNSEFNKWDLNQKISKLHDAVITAFDNRQNENIYVCPMYMGMDLHNDYYMTEVPLSKRDGDKNDGKTRMSIDDRIHQNEVGYWKNADYMYALVKYITAKSLI